MSDNSRERVEIVKSDLLEREVLFGARFQLPVWLRSRSTTPLHIQAVSVTLKPDTGWVGPAERMVFRADIGIELRPGHKELTRVTVIPPLDCLGYSNFVDVLVEYGTPSEIASGRIRKASKLHFDWLLIQDVPAPNGAEVFVSFKDPENEDLAQLAAKYLRRAGLSPYLARDDGRCGCDYWEDKIAPAIGRSSGVLVIWSPDVTRSSEAVRREMSIAKNGDIPLGLFLSADTEPPSDYPASMLEYVRFNPEAPYAGFANGIAAAARRWKQTGRCF